MFINYVMQKINALERLKFCHTFNFLFKNFLTPLTRDIIYDQALKDFFLKKFDLIFKLFLKSFSL